MKYRPVLVTAPATKPVTLEEVKAQLRVDTVDDDTMLNAMIDAAIQHLDGWTGILGRCLEEQQWRQDYDCFAQCLPLPLGPIVSVDSITWRNDAGQLATVAADDYALQTSAGGQSHIRFKSGFPYPGSLNETEAVSVAYTAGYPQTAGVSTVPAPIKYAIILIVQDMHRAVGDGLRLNRDSVDGVGEQQYFRPEAVSEAVNRAVGALTAPYRRVGL